MPGRTPIREWLGDRTDVSVGEVLEHVFGIAKERHSQSAQTRVARIWRTGWDLKSIDRGREGSARIGTGVSRPRKKLAVSVTGVTVVTRHTGHTRFHNKIKERRHDSAGPRAGALRGRGRRR